MQLRAPLASVAMLAAFCQLCSGVSHGQTLTPMCQPSVSSPIIVATHDQIVAAGLRAEPPLTDTKGFGFAWPDTQMGVIKTAAGYEFFTSDGAFHPRQRWQGHEVGNNNYGSVVTTVGTLDNPLGTGNPQDVTISPNPDPGVNPNYSGYTYIGGGPVYQVPEGMTGAGNLLAGYHAELPSNTLYAVHGLAATRAPLRCWSSAMSRSRCILDVRAWRWPILRILQVRVSRTSDRSGWPNLATHEARLNESHAILSSERAFL